MTGQKTKILIVEDERDLVQLVMARLESLGYDIDVAFDALQAMMRLNKSKPDLVLLDISMPAGGGLQVLKNIRLNVKLFNIPVIVVTGSQDEKVKEEAKRLGVFAYYIKPVDAKVLADTIAKALEEKRPD
jgi:CheY-like chemotaxis protein